METTPSVADWALVATAVAAVLIAVAVPLSAYWRRPNLRLTERGARRHSHVEADGHGYLRLVVENARRNRAAKGTRVIVEGYRRQGEAEQELISLAHPSLGWPSAVEARADATVAAVTVHSGSGRPIEFGRFMRVVRGADDRLARGALGEIRQWPSGNPNATWHLLLGLHELSILDDRDKLPPGQWIVRLLVGADDGDARRYDVHVAWIESRPSARSVLDEALERLSIERVTD